MNKVIVFFNECYSELKKSKWLSRDEVIRFTIVVGVVCGLAAVYVGAIDWVLARVIGHFLGMGA